jgi:hypothetical protein
MSPIFRLACCSVAWVVNFFITTIVVFIGYLEDSRSIFIQDHRNVLSPVGAAFINGYWALGLFPFVLLVAHVYTVRKQDAAPTVIFSIASIGIALMEIGYVILYFAVTYQRFHV